MFIAILMPELQNVDESRSLVNGKKLKLGENFSEASLNETQWSGKKVLLIFKETWLMINNILWREKCAIFAFFFNFFSESMRFVFKEIFRWSEVKWLKFLKAQLAWLLERIKTACSQTVSLQGKILIHKLLCFDMNSLIHHVKSGLRHSNIMEIYWRTHRFGLLKFQIASSFSSEISFMYSLPLSLKHRSMSDMYQFPFSLYDWLIWSILYGYIYDKVAQDFQYRMKPKFMQMIESESAFGGIIQISQPHVNKTVILCHKKCKVISEIWDFQPKIFEFFVSFCSLLLN